MNAFIFSFSFPFLSLPLCSRCNLIADCAVGKVRELSELIFSNCVRHQLGESVKKYRREIALTILSRSIQLAFDEKLVKHLEYHWVDGR